jgi:branched-chain amino acid transport system substrate-binding protein
VRARWLGLVALVLSLLAAGCGGVTVTSTIGNQLTIYSGLPLHGPTAAISQQIIDGEKLALHDAGGHVGQFKISYYSMDDANPKNGEADPGVTAQDAKTAAEDTSTIAYLGDYGSDATAISLPVINAAGILQVSPASPYVGLTSSLDAGQDEPGRFYLTGKRTFGRLAPNDVVQAAAQVQLMRSTGVRRLYVLSDEDPFQVPLAEIVKGDALKAGIEVLAIENLDTENSTSFTGTAKKVASSGAQAVFFSGAPGAGAVALWKALYARKHGLRLFASSALLNATFTSEIGAAAQNTLIGTPILPTSFYPPSAQRVLGDYERVFGTRPQAYALYGYEAMSVVLTAIRAAGSHGNDRQTVVNEFFATHDRNSVIGRYSIEPSGDSTISSYGFDRVSEGAPVFDRVLEVPPSG